jgi:hypothetical protein
MWIHKGGDKLHFYILVQITIFKQNVGLGHLGKNCQENCPFSYMAGSVWRYASVNRVIGPLAHMGKADRTHMDRNCTIQKILHEKKIHVPLVVTFNSTFR